MNCEVAASKAPLRQGHLTKALRRVPGRHGLQAGGVRKGCQPSPVGCCCSDEQGRGQRRHPLMHPTWNEWAAGACQSGGCCWQCSEHDVPTGWYHSKPAGPALLTQGGGFHAVHALQVTLQWILHSGLASKAMGPERGPERGSGRGAGSGSCLTS